MHTVTLPFAASDASLRNASSVSRTPTTQAQRQFDSRTLFGEAKEVRIEHFGQEYRLRQTRNGKLILTK